MSSIDRLLPLECFQNIIKLAKEEPNPNLHSCILVNRYWRKNSLPMLWSRPFDNTLAPTKLMNTYISCLSSEQKRYLNNNGIYLRQNSVSSINYPEYLRELKFEILEEYTRSWLVKNNYSDRSADLDTIMDSLKPSEVEYSNIQLNKLLPCLFSMFIEKSINLTYFNFCSNDKLCFDLPKLPDWMSTATSETTALSHASPTRTSSPPAASNNLFEKLSTFICEINHNEIRLPNLIKFMEILPMQCRMLKTINFTWNTSYDQVILVNIIKQQQLREISLDACDNNANFDDVIDELVSTQKCSLIRIQFRKVRASSTCINRFFNSLNEFNKLKMLTLIDCPELRDASQTINIPVDRWTIICI